MSKEEDKVKHSKRIHADKVAIQKQIKIAKAHGLDEALYKTMRDEPNRFAKHHSVDFGTIVGFKKSNPRKSVGEETIQEKRAKQDKVEID
jgi:hypothetical protein